MASRRTPDSSRSSKPAVAKPAKASSTDASSPAAIAPPTAPVRPKRAVKAKTPTAAAAPPAKAHVSDETRRGMIAESAYLRAERRGFAPGGEVEDWIAAEREVDALLNVKMGSGPQ